MKHLKSINEDIDKMRCSEVGGFSPEYKLKDKINELIEVINELEKRLDKLENKKGGPSFYDEDDIKEWKKKYKIN